ncbi:hypothetical protein ACMC56_16395 [Campylobacterota bacterium DY0563]
MLFERYAIKLKENVNRTNIFNIDINEDLYETVEIDGNNFSFSRNHLRYTFENTSYENLIVIYTKPEVIYTTRESRQLFRMKFAYVKTKEDQLIVNVQDWNVVNHLNEYQGLIDFIEIFLIPYDNMMKIAVEYKYHSISPSVLNDVIEQVFINNFIEFGINFSEDLEIVKDYFNTDFEETFNRSRKNKKIIFYIDTVNNGTETVNSAKIEYSIKADITFQNAFDYLRANRQDNILRYSIKCEDEDAKTASIDGINEDLRTSEWVKAARTNVDISTIDENTLNTLSHFLRFIDE